LAVRHLLKSVRIGLLDDPDRRLGWPAGFRFADGPGGSRSWGLDLVGWLGQSGSGIDQLPQTPLGALHGAEQTRLPGVDGGDQGVQHLPHPLVLTFELGGRPSGNPQFLGLTFDHGGQLLDLRDQPAGASTVAAGTFQARQGIVELVEQGVVTATVMLHRAALGGNSTFKITPARADFKTARHRHLQYP
jgi:hypothetical protein